MRVNHASQFGFGLVEVLVASVILAVGLLGLASMQSRAMKISREADNEITAMLLAQDLIQRTMANKSNFNDGRESNYLNLDIMDLNEISTNVENWATTSLTNDPNILDCYTTTGCSSSLMAFADLIEWKRAVAKMLPSGFGKICMDHPVNMASYTCNNTSNPDTGGLSRSIFVLKIKWTSILSNQEQLYITEFGAHCTHVNGCTAAGDGSY